MTEEVKQCLDSTVQMMEKAIQHLEAQLQTIRAGKASPQMVDAVMVEYYGSMTPLNQVSSISTPDARTIQIQPWEKSMLAPIERAIFASNLGFTPQNDGSHIRLNLPPVTEERRRDLVKNAKAEAEHARVSVRNIRRDANENIKKLQKDGLPEDMAKSAEEKIQQMTDNFIQTIEKHLEQKEKEILTV